jgi:hypothetical protein
MRNRFERFTVKIIVLGLFLLLAGCGGGSSSSNGNTNGTGNTGGSGGASWDQMVWDQDNWS